ncbi:MAG: non-canonical purine NTP pyrophosphatase [Verrucomicrobia bacterium]|nr:MAG: non-canonical purine NTP pyrophosphatase [Verrucomicrobiota bacterium]
MVTLLIATRNAHKLAEIQAILGDGFRSFDLNAWRYAPEVIEDAGSFEGNAIKKAISLARWFSTSGRDNSRSTFHVSRITHILADDSGLEVDALNGAPGVHSARFAALDTKQAGNSSSKDNNAKLLRLLKDVPSEKRTARFRCVLALTPVVMLEKESASPVCYADELEMATELFEGVCEGRIGFKLRGKGGFGYDPLFFPAGYNQTFGELPDSVKNELSHRAKALERLKARLNTLSPARDDRQ